MAGVWQPTHGMRQASHRGPGSVASVSESSRASRASSRSRTSASARDPQHDVDTVIEVGPDALVEPTPLAPWRRHEDIGDSSAAAEAALEELADRAAAATLAGLPTRRTLSNGPRRGPGQDTSRVLTPPQWTREATTMSVMHSRPCLRRRSCRQRSSSRPLPRRS